MGHIYTEVRTELTEDEKSNINNLQELQGPEREMFFERKSTLDQNIFNIYGLIWGQCTLVLKYDIIWLDNYGVKSN